MKLFFYIYFIILVLYWLLSFIMLLCDTKQLSYQLWIVGHYEKFVNDTRLTCYSKLIQLVLVYLKWPWHLYDTWLGLINLTDRFWENNWHHMWEIIANYVEHVLQKKIASQRASHWSNNHNASLRNRNEVLSASITWARFSTFNNRTVKIIKVMKNSTA